MHRTLAVLVGWLVLIPCGRGGSPGALDVPGSFPIPRPSHDVKDWGPLDYDDTPGAVPGGLVFIRQGGQRVWRWGGAALPMRIKVAEPGPEGPVVGRMVLPSSGQSPVVPFALQHQAPPFAAQDRPTPGTPAPSRACVQVSIPDPIGLLYLDGRLTDTRGASRLIESPVTGPGEVRVFRLRAAFKVGENLLIQDKDVVVRAGQLVAVTFDGTGAVAVPLPGTGPKPNLSPP